MSETKTCISCKHVHLFEGPCSDVWTCRRDKKDPHLVTGVVNHKTYDCFEERFSKNDTLELCGKEGKYWEPK